MSNNELATQIQSEMEEWTGGDPVLAQELVVQAAKARALALRAGTLVQTLPTDWVRHRSRSGDEFCYLQDKGCQRTASLWGVSFDPVSMRDFEREELPGGEELPKPHVNYSIMVTGRARVGDRMLERTEIGSRSTAGDVWRKQWEDPETTAAERFTILQHVKKAALTNAHGRITRALTGMSGMPVNDVCAALKCKPENIPGIEYKSGAKGGGQQGSGPNEGQLKALTFQAIEHVEGMTRDDFDKTMEVLSTSCPEFTSRECSQAIDWLKQQKGRVPKQAFWSRVKFRKPEAAPATEPKQDPAPQGANQGTAPAASGQDPSKCPGCQRTMDVINDDGHTPECSSPNWSAKP